MHSNRKGPRPWDASPARPLWPRALLAAAVAATAVGAACSKDNAPTSPTKNPSPTDTVAGSFALSTVDTKALPFAIASDPGNYSLEITAGTAVLQSTGQFTMTITSRETVAGYASTYIDSTSGTWTQQAGAVVFTIPATSATSVAAWDGANLSMVQDSVTYVYKKR